MGFITTEKSQGGGNIGYYHWSNTTTHSDGSVFMQFIGFLSKDAYTNGEQSISGSVKQMQIPMASLGIVDHTSLDAVRKASYDALNAVALDVQTSKDAITAVEANPDATEQEKTDAAANKAALPQSHEEFSFFAAATKDL